MKKLLAGLFIFGFLAIGVQVTHASVLSDALLKIDSLQKELVSLKAKLGASVLDSVSAIAPVIPTVAPITPTTDLTPRISYWSGKVNQHVSVSEGMWQTDSDGSSGAGIDKLTYCKKWYPNTTSVEEYKNETINAWHNAGNIGDYASTKMSYKCVQQVIVPTPATPSITVLSPNGGETYTDGQSITVKWMSSNISSSSPVNLVLAGYNSDGVMTMYTLLSQEKILNDGLEIVTLPKIPTYSGTKFGNYFKVFVTNGVGNEYLEDTSNNYFTINTSTVNVCSLSATIVDTYLSSDKTGWGFHVIVNAKNKPNNSSGWTANFEGYTPSVTTYGVNKAYGNFFLSSGPLSLTAIDQIDSNCKITTTITPPVVIALPSTPTTDTTPRISMWQGKVNQHVVAGDVYTWQTDADGVSGAELDKLTYCKKFYPNTTSVEEYKNETINTWYNAGNKGNYTGTKMSYRCVQGTTSAAPSLKVSLDSTSPINQAISAGSGKITFAKIKITTSSNDISLNAIQIASDLANSTKLNNLAIYDGDTKIGVTNNGLTYNGSYYQSWVYLSNKFVVPANTSKVLSIIADTSPVGSSSAFSGTVRLGVAGWTFDYPGATISPSGAIYGSTFIVNYNESVVCPSNGIPFVKVVTPNGGEIYQAGQEIVVGWSRCNGEGNISEINLIPSDMKYGTGITLVKDISSDKGIYTVKLPTSSVNDYYSFGKNFKIEIVAVSNKGDLMSDSSDDLFTITDSTVNSNDTTSSAQLTRTLKFGMRGKDVMILQKFLEIVMDGVYGRTTVLKVKQWQLANGLVADGVFGSASRIKSGLGQ